MTLRTAFRLGRVSNLPTVLSNVFTGAVLSGVASPSPLTLAAWFAVMALFYVGGMYLNDAFDHRWDAAHRPERPIPAGDVRAGTVYAAGFGMLAAGAAFTFWLAGGLPDLSRSLPALGAAVGLGAAIVAYDVFHKQNPLSPVLMGVCRVLVYASVLLGLGGSWSAEATLASLALLGYLTGLTYVARQETLREVKNLWPLVLLAAPAVVGWPEALDVQALCLVLWAAWVLNALRRVVRTENRDIGGAVARLIAGISLVDAILVAPHDTRLAVACVATVGLTRLFHRFIAGT